MDYEKLTVMDKLVLNKLMAKGIKVVLDGQQNYDIVGQVVGRAEEEEGWYEK